MLGFIYSFFIFSILPYFYYNLFTIVDIQSRCRGFAVEFTSVEGVPFIRIRIIRIIRGRYPRALVIAEVDGVACHGGGVAGCRGHEEVGAAGAQRPGVLRVAQGVVGAQHDNLVDVAVGDAERRVLAHELAVVAQGVAEADGGRRVILHGHAGERRIADVAGVLAGRVVAVGFGPLDDVGRAGGECASGYVGEVEGQQAVGVEARCLAVERHDGHAVAVECAAADGHVEGQAEGVPGAVLVEGAAAEGYGEGLACVVGDGGGVAGGVGQGEAGLEGLAAEGGEGGGLSGGVVEAGAVGVGKAGGDGEGAGTGLAAIRIETGGGEGAAAEGQNAGDGD